MMKQKRMIDVRKLEYWAKKKEKQNYRFRTFLKINADPDELDDQFKRLHQEFFSQYDCSQCRNCCIKYCGTIPAIDLVKVANYLGITQKELKEKYLKNEPDSEGYRTKHTPCDFLKDGDCLLGDCKPTACRDFPYTDRADRMGSLLGIVENTAICPIVYEMMEELKKEYNFR